MSEKTVIIKFTRASLNRARERTEKVTYVAMPARLVDKRCKGETVRLDPDSERCEQELHVIKVMLDLCPGWDYGFDDYLEGEDLEEWEFDLETVDPVDDSAVFHEVIFDDSEFV